MSSLNEYTEKLCGPDEIERLYAAEDIGYLNAPDGVAPLVARVGEEQSHSVREAIFQALIRMDGDAPIAGAIALLGSDSPLIRNQAVDVLRRKGVSAIPSLRQVMLDGDKDMRKLVLDVLADIPSGRAQDIYAAALNDEDPNVVITGVENLGRIRAEYFRAQIETLLENQMQPMLTAACLEALAGIANPISLLSVRRRFPDISVLPDYLLIPCLRAIGALGARQEFDEAGRLLSPDRPNLHSAILGAMLATCSRGTATAPPEVLLETLREIVTSGKVALSRYQAARLLGLWVERDDICEFLVASLESTEALVRLGAAESLRQIGRAGLVPSLAAHTLEEFNGEDPQTPVC